MLEAVEPAAEVTVTARRAFEPGPDSSRYEAYTHVHGALRELHRRLGADKVPGSYRRRIEINPNG